MVKLNHHHLGWKGGETDMSFNRGSGISVRVSIYNVLIVTLVGLRNTFSQRVRKKSSQEVFLDFLGQYVC